MKKAEIIMRSSIADTNPGELNAREEDPTGRDEGLLKRSLRGLLEARRAQES